MGNYIALYRKELSERNYIRKAEGGAYWYDFSTRKLAAYRERFGGDFTLVVYGVDDRDDSYVIPYPVAATLLTAERADKTGRRWIGTIRHGRMNVSPGGYSIPVERFYNAYDLLGGRARDSIEVPEEADADRTEDGGEVDPQALRQKIWAFNLRYKEESPERRPRVSEAISRPGAIATHLKKLCGFRCQLCGKAGFRQKGGDLYAEAHHLLPLHELLPESLCSDNIVVVCPDCHRKLHHADVGYGIASGVEVAVVVNGEGFRFERNEISGE